MTETKLEITIALAKAIDSSDSIKNHIEEIHDLRQQLNGDLSIKEETYITSQIKSKLQAEANQALDVNGGTGAIYMATATGKSKVGVDRCRSIIDGNYHHARILIAVPTEKLRDENWKEEFRKWNPNDKYEDIWRDHIDRECYASLHKMKGLEYDLVILDEAHNLTEGNSVFFESNIIKSIVALTATPPVDQVKIDIFRRLGLKPVYTVTLDEAIKLGITAPYDITVVTVPLNNKEKYVKAGSKAKPFYITEQAQYSYLSKVIDERPSKFAYLKRMRFIYDLKSKLEAAKKVRNTLTLASGRRIIFCGSIKIAEQLSIYTYHSKSTDIYLEAFKAKHISELACVKALNEGHNIDDVDYALVEQLDSKALNLIQRMGRILRFRVGHRGQIIIVCAENTVDVDWVLKATKGLNIANIKWMTIDEFVNSNKRELVA